MRGFNLDVKKIPSICLAFLDTVELLEQSSAKTIVEFKEEICSVKNSYAEAIPLTKKPEEIDKFLSGIHRMAKVETFIDKFCIAK